MNEANKPLTCNIKQSSNQPTWIEKGKVMASIVVERLIRPNPQMPLTTSENIAASCQCNIPNSNDKGRGLIKQAESLEISV